MGDAKLDVILDYCRGMQAELTRLRDGQALLLDRLGVMEDTVQTLATQVTDGTVSGGGRGDGGGGGGADAAATAKAAADALLAEMDRRRLEEARPCVQCGVEFKDHENADAACAYHPGHKKYTGAHRKPYEMSCCGEGTTWDGVPGNACTKGRHHASHHVEFPYSSYYEWALKRHKELDIEWGFVERKDRDRKVGKSGRLWARVGVQQSSGELVLLLGGALGVSVNYCGLLSVGDVLFAAKKRVEVVNEVGGEAEGGWHVRATWSITNGTIEGMVLSVRAPGDEQPDELLVKFSVGDSRFQFDGETQWLHRAPVPRAYDLAGTDESFDQLYSLPESFTKGEPFVQPPTPAISRHKFEGEAGIRVKQVEDVTVNQAMWKRDGKLAVWYTAVVAVQNPAEAPVTVFETTVEWQRADGDWVLCDETFLGPRDSGGRVAFKQDHSMDFVVEPASSLQLGIQGSISVEDCEAGRDNQRRARTPAGLPQPMKLRLTMTTVDDKSVSLIVEQANRQLSMHTQESVAKNNKVETMHHFVECSSIKELSNAYVAVYRKDRQLVVYRPGRYMQFTEEALINAVYEAVVSKKTEHELDSLTGDSDGVSIRVWLLIDLAHKRAYGLRCHLKSECMEVQSACYLPMPPVKPVRLSVAPTVVPPRAPLSINWADDPEANDRDMVYIVPRFGIKSVAYSYRKGASTVTLDAPAERGLYDVYAVTEHFNDLPHTFLAKSDEVLEVK